MENCIFCKIVNNEIPSEKIYEDETYLAFLDIAPVKHGHTLVIPKAHVANFMTAPTKLIDNLLNVCQKLGNAILKATDGEGYNLSVNSGEAAGQTVHHLHFHIIPRHTGDGLKLWPQERYPEGEDKKMGEKIRQALD